jgi:phosphoribosylformimino-5-aminoimidazole carboxamide ribotide isomerase
VLIIPAIDLLGGKVVRLSQGDYSKVKVYSEKPEEIAKRWKDEGARLAHVVDLDGARSGKPTNLLSVERIIRAGGLEVELGGGIREFEDTKRAFGIGVSKIVLGTTAISKRNFSRKCLAKYSGEKVIFSIDARNKHIYTQGWGTDSGYALEGIIKEFEGIGLKRIIYTDIARDGMLEGPNIASIKDILKNTNLEIIASGGISGIEDIKKIKALNSDKLVGVIIGKALYEGKIDLAEAIRVGSNT